MATIVRVKRRRDADPLEVLQLATKKQRQSEDEPEAGTSSSSNNLFKFAGTVVSKDSGVSQKVREAIRKDKLEKEYKRHQADILGEVHTRNRQQNRENSIQNRFTVTAKHRAIALDNLDEVSTSVNNENDKRDESNDSKQADSVLRKDSEDSVCSICGKKILTEKEESRCICNKNRDQNGAGLGLNGATKDRGNSTSEVKGAVGRCDTDNVGKHVNGNVNTNGSEKPSGAQHQDDSSKGASNGQSEVDRMFCLVDMELDRGPSFDSLERSLVEDQITCNGQAMVQEAVTELRNDDEYVYDIYYTNNQNFDFRMFENDLTFETMRNEVHDPDYVDDEYVYEDDDDDENAESNWRNDYPDRDPGFLDNLETDYMYPNDMVGLGNFDTAETNQLADWMSWRMNLEDGAELSSDDDEVDRYEVEGSSYEAYYKKVKKEKKDTDD